MSAATLSSIKRTRENTTGCSGKSHSVRDFRNYTSLNKMVDLTMMIYEILVINCMVCFNLKLLSYLVLKPVSCPALADYWCVSPVSCFPVYFNPPLWWSPAPVYYLCVTSSLPLVFYWFVVFIFRFLPASFLFGCLNLKPFLMWPCASYWVKGYIVDFVPLLGSLWLHLGPHYPAFTN